MVASAIESSCQASVIESKKKSYLSPIGRGYSIGLDMKCRHSQSVYILVLISSFVAWSVVPVNIEENVGL